MVVVLGVIGFAYEQRARAREARSYGPPGRLVPVEPGAFRLHLDCAGQGSPTVVLIHGLQGSYLDWYLVQPRIAQFTRVCTFERAGYGWSEPSPRPRVPSAMAEELHDALQAAGEKPPFVVVGHSFGTVNAEMFAYKFPDAVSGLVLVDGVLPEMLVGFPLSEKLWLRAMQFTVPFGLPRWRRWCGGSPAVNRELMQVTQCRSRYFETIIREWSAFPQTAAELRGITSLGNMPLIVIARDPATDSLAESHHLDLEKKKLAFSTNSRLVIAEGSGHDIPFIRPDVIVQAVRSLVRPQAPAGSRGTP